MFLVFKKIGFIFFILCHTLVFGQVKFVATLSPNRIGINDFTQLNLTLTSATAVENIKQPNLKDFDIISGPNVETSTIKHDGVVKNSISFTYVLKPKNKGSFTIPATVIIVAGKAYTCNAVGLQVVNTTPNAIAPMNNGSVQINPDYVLKKGENIEEKVKKNMFVKVEVDKTTCFVGEPIVATYKLYTRLKSESNLVKNPSYNGFSVIDLETSNNMNYTTEKFGGKNYNVVTIRKSQLYPLQAGTITLEEAEVENTVHFVKEDYIKQQQNSFDFFDELQPLNIPPEALEIYKVSLKNTPLSITIKPLPQKNKPANFEGAVGKFNVAIAFEKDSITTDETGKLRLMINGQGNLQLVTLPEIKFPNGIENFEPKNLEEIDKLAIPIQGKKIVEYSFSASQPGIYTIDSILFSYFDITTASYKTIKTKPLQLKVVKGNGKPVTLLPTEKNKSKWNTFFNNRIWIIGSIITLVLISLFVWHKKENKKQVIIQQQKITENLLDKNKEEELIAANKNYLLASEAALLQSDSTNFYKIINTEFKIFLAHKFKLDITLLTKKNVAEKLDEHAVPITKAIQTQQLLDDIEVQLYSPLVQDENKVIIYNKAIALIEELKLY